MLILNSQGTPVSCIFLFCDIRQFTDATECLQEEVFVFTNRIAEVVHSICHSYGGSANKNVGDAFLVSWLLEDDSNGVGRFNSSRTSQTFMAKHHQADKALLSVVKICIALHHDEYYVKTMSDHPRTTLLNKLKDRPGPVVQMGFGLHAGKAVQGAIGSQRKIDATYVSEAVQRAEYLETSTKKYKVPMLMSDSFYGLLHPSNRRRCRKIDQIMFINEAEDDYEYEEELLGQGDVMELYTYDLDVDALWEDVKKERDGENNSVESEELSLAQSTSRMAPPIPPTSSLRGTSSRTFFKSTRRISMRAEDLGRAASITTTSQGQLPSFGHNAAGGVHDDGKESTSPEEEDKETRGVVPELVLPTGPALYSNNIWSQSDMRLIRRRYSPGVLAKYSHGLKKYYEGDWNVARQCFEAVMDRFEDGPSQYFLKQMDKHGGVCPPHFEQYGRA
jgi:class 3 adenylate cyclase